MIETIKKFKELMKNKRYKAMFKLGLFILFFIIVFILIELNSNDEYLDDINSSNQQGLFDIDNYSFNYLVQTENMNNVISTNLTLDGYRNENKYVFEVLEHNKKYYYEETLFTYDDTILPYTGNKFIDVELYSPENIEKYIKKGKLDSTTTYSDGTIKKEYKIEVVTFASLIGENIITLEGDVVITIYQKENKLQSVELDLIKYNKSNIIIEYSNLNNIVKFDKESLLK